MGKYTFRAAALIMLAAVFLFTTIGLAAEEPSFSDAARAAAPVISVETEKIEQGGLLSVRVSLGEGSVAAKAAVYTEGLQFVNTSGGLGTQGTLALLEATPSVVYNYKVIAEPRQTVRFALNDVAVLLNADGQDEPAPGAHWSGTVSGKPNTQPVATPSPDVPIPTTRPEGPLVIPGSADISVEGDLAQGKTVEVVISTTADGMQADLATKGLEFVEVDSTFCDAASVILVRSEGSTASAKYTYLVKAGPGEEVSVDVTGVTLSVNGSDVAGTSSTWINWVPTTQAPGSSPSASSVPSPSSHIFTLHGGLSLTTLQSGRTVVVGGTATRNGKPLSEFLTFVEVPAGYRVRVVGSDGTVLSGSKPVATGCELQVLSADGSIVDRAVIGLRGDVRGSGVMDVGQVVQVAQCLNDSRVPTELQAFCADMNSNGRIDITDLVSMANLLV